MAVTRFLRSHEWGMRWARPPYPERMPDPYAVVHHTAGGRISSDAAAAFRGLNEAAINWKDYSATDYDFLIHYWEPTDTLTIGEARGPWYSAATLDFNEEGEAYCLMGYFHPGHSLSQQPHPREIEGIALAIKWGIDLGFNAPDCQIIGHRDNPKHPGATGCPGDFLYPHLPTIRTRVAELLNPPPVYVPEDNMSESKLWRPKGYQNIFIITPSGNVLHASLALLKAFGLPSTPAAINAVVINDDHPETLKSMLSLAGLKYLDLVAA